MKGRPTKALVAVAVAYEHLANVVALLERFGTTHFDFVLFHWDAYRLEWEEDPTLAEVEAAGALRHIWRFQWPKLAFAREFLAPTATKAYSHVFVWDGDVKLTPGFDPVRLLSVAVATGAFLFQPALTEQSAGDHDHNKLGKDAVAADGAGNDAGERCAPSVDFVEVGFMVWDSRAWEVAWGVLDQYPFKIWCFDLLPFGCMLRRKLGALARTPPRTAVVFTDPVHHGGNRKTLDVDWIQVKKEDDWFLQIWAEHSCPTEEEGSVHGGSGRPYCMHNAHRYLLYPWAYLSGPGPS